MQNVSIVQIHCPFCNGAQSSLQEGNYVCEFCLQPFSVVQAQNEESRILEEIKGWLEKKVGSAGLSPGSVDASSRAFIFQQKVLPDLRRDVDRSLELLGTYGQFPLVPLPIATPRPSSSGPNPLVESRQEILALKNLRARLASEQVTSFAIGGSDQALIQTMDRRLADVVHLSNVADSASRKDAAGYATARHNLLSLLEEVGQSITLEGPGNAALGRFLAGIKSRYERLTEICSVCEELSSTNSVTGGALADRLQEIAARLREAAAEVEDSDYSPADSMPIVVGVRQEAQAAELLARWLRAYDVLADRAGLPFSKFVGEVNSLYDDHKFSPEAKVDMIEGCAWLIRAVRGEVSISIHDDFGWVDAWAEGSRAKKSFGMFGTEERILQLDKFLLPVWVADVTFSRSAGKVFKAGVENRCVAVVDACGPAAAKVLFLEGDDNPILRALSSSRGLSSRSVALPASTAAAAQNAFSQAASSRPDIQNPRVQVRGLAFLPAAIVELESKNGRREIAACTGGQVPLDAAVRGQIVAARQAFEKFA